MQRLTNPEYNIHKIFNDFDVLYSVLSEKQWMSGIIQLNLAVNRRFQPLIDIFKQYGWDRNDVTYFDYDYKPLQLEYNPQDIIVSFSGGKDSTATALYYKERGYNVYLYHLHGINKMYKDEHLAAEQVAKLLGLPYIEEDIKITGWVQPDWIEHPMKNMIIANRAVQWAIRNNISPNIAFGNFSSSTLESDPFEVCGGDCREMWDIYDDIISNVIPDFKVQIPLINMQDTITSVLENQYVINDTQSCIMPYHYKQRLRKRHAEKYTYKLPKNRCGSCWKCAVEYIVLCDNNVWEYDPIWYEHCLTVLKNTLRREQGLRIDVLSDVWEHYFFYDIEKSKFLGEQK